MPVHIIDILEVINVEQDQRKPGLIAFGTQNFHRQCLVELQPIEKTSERVGDRPKFHLPSQILQSQPLLCLDAIVNPPLSAKQIDQGHHRHEQSDDDPYNTAGKHLCVCHQNDEGPVANPRVAAADKLPFSVNG